MKITYNKFDAIIGNSKELSKDLSDYLNLKTSTIYNSVQKINYNNTKIKKKSKRTILSVGRLEKQKDHLTLLKAVKNLKNKNNLKLIALPVCFLLVCTQKSHNCT